MIAVIGECTRPGEQGLKTNPGTSRRIVASADQESDRRLIVVTSNS